MANRFLVALGLVLVPSAGAWAADLPPYRNPDLPVDVRVKDLVSRLTLDEKASLMKNGAAAVPRLGIPRYNWWNEALHGVARSGHATVYPQAIALAAMWDDAEMGLIARTIATEARAKFAAAPAQGKQGAMYYGLTFWTPNINLFRDPRWGRGQETYGEDPYLTSRVGVAFVRGLQGDDPRYWEAVACAKHFAVHSGPEPMRHILDVDPDPRDFHDTYLPAFEALVREAHVGGVMTAYNSLEGKPCAINGILYDLLYRQWGFEGYVTSDCGAVEDLYRSYHVAKNLGEAEAMALHAGLCLRCGQAKSQLADAVRQGLLTAGELDERLEQLFRIQMKLGFFDPAERVPYAKIAPAENDTPAHRAQALRAAEESMVLLKNDGVLPLDPAKVKHLAVVGPNADSLNALVGNYSGDPSHPVTILAGLKGAFGAAAVERIGNLPAAAKPGADAGLSPAAGRFPILSTAAAKPGADAGLSPAELERAKRADVIVFVGGLTAKLEGEEMKVDLPGFKGGDRTRIELPEVQERALKALAATGRPVVFVLMSGSAVAIPWESEHLNAIVEAWYPGESGGTAAADLLTGKANPSGRLPVTFYRSTEDLPAFTDYAMDDGRGRTYRYFKGQALYPFGYGLSYTRFAYGELKVDSATGGKAPSAVDEAEPGVVFHASVEVANRGDRDGDEVVQIYARPPEARELRGLVAFRRVHLRAGESETVTFDIVDRGVRRWDERAKAYRIPPGTWTLWAGGSSEDLPQQATLKLSGS